MAKTGKRELRDPIRRLEATLRSIEFRDVVHAYRRRFDLPPRSGAAKPSGVDCPDEPGWEKARLHDKGALGDMARAAERICDWLDISCEAVPILARHVFFGVPLSQDFTSRFADPLKKPALERTARLGEFDPEGSIGSIHGRRAKEILALPQLRRQDLPLLLLVEDTAEGSWAERVDLWNSRFPRRRVERAETLARYCRGAKRREAQQQRRHAVIRR